MSLRRARWAAAAMPNAAKSSNGRASRTPIASASSAARPVYRVRVLEAQLDPAAITRVHHHGQPGLGERIDVAQDGPASDLELAGQRLAGHASPVLQQQEDLQQARCPHREEYDTRRQLPSRITVAMTKAKVTYGAGTATIRGF